MIWAASWQNQQNGMCPSEDSDQSGHPPSLIRAFAVRMKKAWILSYPLSAQRRLWSDWADAQAIRPGWSESSLGAQSLCRFCNVAAHLKQWCEGKREYAGCRMSQRSPARGIECSGCLYVCTSIRINTRNVTEGLYLDFFHERSHWNLCF